MLPLGIRCSLQNVTTVLCGADFGDQYSNYLLFSSIRGRKYRIWEGDNEKCHESPKFNGTYSNGRVALGKDKRCQIHYKTIDTDWDEWTRSRT